MKIWPSTWAGMLPRLAIPGIALVLLGASCSPASPSVEFAADAGQDQTVVIGDTVELDGAGSNDPQGLPLTYAWQFTSRPATSSAALSNAQTVTPSFVPDMAGTYAVQLTVSNGADTDTDTVQIVATEASATSLEDGAVVEGVDGVLVGAVEGSLESPIDVTSQQVDDPSPSTPFPPGTAPVSPYYRVAFSRDVDLDPARSLIFGIPVPDGVATDNLAIAFFATPDPFEGGDGESPAWMLYPATYDPGSGAVFAALTSASTAGRTAVLVEGDQLDSTPPEAIATEHVGAATGFFVRCVGFDPGKCTESDRTAVRTALEEAYAAWVTGLGFNEPALLRRPAILSLFPLHIHYGLYDYMIYDFRMEVCDDSDGVGAYNRKDTLAYTCYDPNETAPSTLTTRHEFFHALQYGYPAYLANRGNVDNGFAEGTAAAAESSQNGLNRSSNFQIRRVDVGLFDDNSPATRDDYRAQDFFVYVGLRFGMDLDYLIPILQAGADVAAIDTVFRTEPSYPENPSLSDLYWDWVKNQTFEQNVEMGDSPRFGNVCTYVQGSAAPERIRYEHIAPPANRTLTVSRLNTHVVRLDLISMEDASYSAQVTVTPSSPEGKVKIYDEDDGDSTACQTAPDDNVVNVQVPAGDSRTYYIVMSNPQLSGTIDFDVDFTVDPVSLEILSPTQGASFTEGDTIDLTAVATGFQGRNPDQIEIHWTYTRSDGVLRALAATENGEPFSTDGLCDRAYTVTATVLGVNTSLSDTVDFSVADLGATSPPAECAVGISIVNPPSGAKVPSGSNVTFEAEITNDRPWDEDVRYPITWRDGGPSGSLLAEDTLTFSKSDLSVGLHTIWVEYGSGTDQIEIEVVNASEPPSVAITSPDDGAVFSWMDSGAGTSYYDVDFVASGSGSAPLSYTWSYREQGDTSYTAAGTGSTTTIGFGYTCPSYTTYDVRVVLEDAGGVTATDEISIQVRSPPC